MKQIPDEIKREKEEKYPRYDDYVVYVSAILLRTKGLRQAEGERDEAEEKSRWFHFRHDGEPPRDDFPRKYRQKR